MNNVSQLLLARDSELFEAQRAGASAELAGLFPAAEWEVRLDAQLYASSNYDNIWNNEARRGLIHVLEAANIGTMQYREWLGEMHYTRVIAAPRRLFTDGYKDNQGWRVLALGVPAVGVVVVGLASHYQNAQNHGHLASASNVFFEHISTIAVQRDVPMRGRKVNPRDWEGTGLFTVPRLTVAHVDVSAVNPAEPGVWLKDVRTTTLKKVLASFMTLESLDQPAVISDTLEPSLMAMRDLANMLLGEAQ